MNMKLMIDAELGVTGEFPSDKICEDNKGELKIAIDRKGNNVFINFGTPVVWIGMPSQEAMEFANMVIKCALEAIQQKNVTLTIMRPEHKFDRTREEWERVVFKEAKYFTCSRYLGRKVDPDGSKFQTNTHPNILEAVKDAVQGKATGRQPMVYAVAASGRNVLIPRNQWIELITQFAKRNPEYKP